MLTMPKLFCLGAGSSEGFSELNAFDGALLEAGVGNTNLVRMSSILPPDCVQKESIQLPYGALVPVAYASCCSSRSGEMISSAIAIGMPEDKSLPGVIMEHSEKNQNAKNLKIHVEQMAEEALRMRRWTIKEIKSISIDHQIRKIGATFAGVVLWH